MAVRITECVCVLVGAEGTAVALSLWLPVVNKEMCWVMGRPKIEDWAGAGSLSFMVMFVCISQDCPSLSHRLHTQTFVCEINTGSEMNFLSVILSHTWIHPLLSL